MSNDNDLLSSDRRSGEAESSSPPDLGAIAARAQAEGEEAAEHFLETLVMLADPASYDPPPSSVEVVETHMSVVFLVGERVYKLKRPIRLSFIDFRTVDQRRRSCETETAINRGLAPDVYRGVVPVTREHGGQLAVDGKGVPIDWLVVMRRLDEDRSLASQVERGLLRAEDLEGLCAVLAEFYRKQRRPAVSSEDMLALWHQQVELAASSLTDRLFALPDELTAKPIAAMRAFLADYASLIEERVEHGMIIDGHGDLKPEHVYLGPPVQLIDRLDFDERLRWSDPFDEVGFLGMECAMLGAEWVLPKLTERMARELGAEPPLALQRFYWCYRACLRARLSIEHLRDEAPRTPERWPRQARRYLRFAAGTLPFQAQS